MIASKQAYDPNLWQSNTASRKASNVSINLNAVEYVASLSVDEMMELAEKRKEDFSEIHANIMTFYVVSSQITPPQKATMAAFLLQHPDLIGFGAPEPAKDSSQPIQPLAPEAIEKLTGKPAETGADEPPENVHLEQQMSEGHNEAHS